MAQLKIESMDFSDEAFQPLVLLITKSVSEAFELQKKRKELPEWMNKQQACEYCNVAYNTLTKKFIPNGLKVSTVDGVERISKTACNEFLEKYES